MEINADFAKPAHVDTAAAAWVPSPMPGVERIMLDRIGDEVARATSIVRYAPGSAFSTHTHDLGEEFLVLDGTFVDEHGAYPAGTYVRNPPGTCHTPSAPAGCTLFVKLRQFRPGDMAQFRIDTRTAEGWGPGRGPGIHVLPLHVIEGERVVLVRFEADAVVPLHEHPGGEEILVLAGTVADEAGRYAQGHWCRFPAGSRHAVTAGPDGALIYVKQGHLADLPGPHG